jgi:hypothetical protein
MSGILQIMPINKRESGSRPSDELRGLSVQEMMDEKEDCVGSDSSETQIGENEPNPASLFGLSESD